MKRALLIFSDETAAAETEIALSGSGWALAARVATLDEARQLMAEDTFDAVLLHSRLEGESAIPFAASMGSRAHPMPVVVVASKSEPVETWRALLDAGLRDVAVPPLDPDSMGELLERACSRSSEAPPVRVSEEGSGKRGAVITVCSARNGTGKTLVSVNLAASLSKANYRVILLDFTAEAGDLSLALDDVPKNNLGDLINAGGTPDADLVESVLASHPLGFRYLSSPNEGFDPVVLGSELSFAVVDTAAHMTDIVIVDTGDWRYQSAHGAIQASDLVLVLTPRDLLRVQATRRLLEEFGRSGEIREKLRIVVNLTDVAEEITDDDLQKLFGRTIEAGLPSSPLAAQSLNTGKPLVATRPKDPLAVALADLARRSAEQSHAVKSAVPKEKQESKGWSLFGLRGKSNA
jgi:pilus assembly protein CpaE